MTDPSLELSAPSAADPAGAAAPVEQSAQTSSSASMSTLVLEAPAPGRPGGADPGRRGGPDRGRRASQARHHGRRATSRPCPTLDPHSPAFTDKVRDIAKLGDDDIRASAAVSNRLLDKPLAAMQNGGLTETSAVSQIAPEPAPPGRGSRSRRSRATSSVRTSCSGILPFGAGDRLREYFEKYRSSQHAARLDHHRACTTGRTSSSATTPRSSRRRSTSGRSWAACASTPTSPSSSMRRCRRGSPRSRPPIPNGRRSSRRTCCSPSARSTRTC